MDLLEFEVSERVVDAAALAVWGSRDDGNDPNPTEIRDIIRAALVVMRSEGWIVKRPEEALHEISERR